ncbi:MAG TPA: NAD(P)-dependent oxidoreductase [Acidimicrobiales bacterium]|nr:NAD(P)-dependent oxidoreductase [Acidimicrobiales bacterium]
MKRSDQLGQSQQRRSGSSAGEYAGPRRVVLVTGATGRVGFPLARALSRNHQVYGMARFTKPNDEARLQEIGVVPLACDLGEFDAGLLPSGLTHIFHAGALTGGSSREDWRRTFEVNTQATGRLVAACKGMKGVKGLVFCSTGSAYAYQGQRPLREDDPPGVHLGFYSLSKIAAEQVVRFASIEFGVPVTIIRIFSTYGPLGGAPADRLQRIIRGKEIVLHTDRPNNYNPIYEDDYVRLGIRALDVASVPPVIVNLAGSETVSAEEYCAYLGELVGRSPIIRHTPNAPWSLWPDVTLMHEILGRAEVGWREGMKRLVEATDVGATRPRP